MYCEKCGKEIRDDALFCGHYGRRIDDGSKRTGMFHMGNDDREYSLV